MTDSTVSAEDRIFYGQPGDEAAGAMGECVWVHGDYGQLLCCNAKCWEHHTRFNVAKLKDSL